MPPYSRRFPLAGSIEPGKLYGELCAVLPPQYAVGQGYSADTLRFALEAGAQAEIRLSPPDAGWASCTVCYRARDNGAAAERAEVYLDLFTELMQTISGRLATGSGGKTK